MAELAPLTLAHAHARKAETAPNPSASADEHEHAATDFARSARGTSDNEALRILKLLEEHHLKLARLLRTRDASEQVGEPAVESRPADLAVSTRDFARSSDQAHPAGATSKSTTAALAAARFGSQARDSSPSLARDIASRRGIPQATRNPPSAAAQVRAAPLSPESHRRSTSGAQHTSTAGPKIPPSVIDSQTLRKQADLNRKAENDDAFGRFYSNLTTGTMSKLSSVLAYAGLPLTADDIPVEPDRQKLNRRTVHASNDPDPKKLFSKAALDALEDEHRKRGTQGGVFGPAESFYVVQTGGGTYSYADIAKSQQHDQKLSGFDEDDEDSFVDAQEAQAPSPRQSRLSGAGRSSFGKSRTYEELELENTTLKNTLEQLAVRLANFETHAQDASMAALTQSMTSLKGAPSSTVPTDAASRERLKQLERLLEEQTEECQRLENVRVKQEKTLKHYKAKWDDIKKSAKEKEKAKRERSEKDGGEASVSGT